MTVRFQNQLVRDVTQVAHASKLGDPQIVDARAAARFRGDVPEPREGLRAGHIPGARNVPFTELLNDDKTMKTPEQTRAIFEAAGVDLAKPVITSCGSGITAAVLAHPRLCYAALAALARSTVHAVLVASPILALWPWAQLPADERELDPIADVPQLGQRAGRVAIAPHVDHRAAR